MTEIMPPGPPPAAAAGQRRALFVPLILMALLLAGLLTVIVLAQRSGDSGAPPQPPAFQVPAPVESFVVYSVQQAEAGNLDLSAVEGPSGGDVAIPAGATIEIIRPSAIAAIQPGDWLTGIGVPNQVRNSVFRAIIAIPAGETAPEGFLRTPGGFRGHEASPDPIDIPAFGGLVESVSGETTTLTTSAGPATLSLVPTEGAGSPPIYRYETGSIEDIPTGARVAFPAVDGQPDPAATAVLVWIP